MNKETKVGIFVAVMLVLLFLGANFLKGINFFLPANKYYAIYDNIDQLSVSNPVLMSGYTVGRVSNISILQNRNGRVLVELDIDSDIILGDSSTAILNADFLGNKSIILNNGNIAKPLKRGDTLYTDIARGIVDMFTEQAEPVANNIQITLLKLDAVLDLLALNSARLDTIFTGLMYTPGLVNRLLVNSNNKVDSMSSDVTQITDDLSTVLKSMAPPIKDITTFSKSLNQLELVQTLTKMQNLLSKLTKILDKVDRKDNTLGKLITEDSLYVNINALILRLDTLAMHLDNDPKQFLAPFGKTRKQIEKIRRKMKTKK